MKRIKKLAAAMLTAIMMMTMTVTAYAAVNCTLTVNVKSGGGVPQQTLKDQTINYKSTLASVLSIDVNSTNEQIVKAVTNLGESNNAKVQKFANDFTAKALTDNLGVTKTSGKITGENTTSYTFNDLDAGYYLVYVTGGKEIQSSLVTVDKNTNTVNLKTEAPSITKKANTETVKIGQVVQYTVTGSIPDTTGYSEYVYKIHDELSTGLDFVNDADGAALTGNTVNVKIAFTDGADASTAPTTAILSGIGNRTMALDLSAWVRTNQANKGKEFTVIYYAKVNTNAVVTEKNKAKLEYGNNSGDTTTTTPSEAKTPTYPLDINKIKKGSDEKLAGAKFSLYTSAEDAKNGKNAIKVSGNNGNYVVDPLKMRDTTFV